MAKTITLLDEFDLNPILAYYFTNKMPKSWLVNAINCRFLAKNPDTILAPEQPTETHKTAWLIEFGPIPMYFARFGDDFDPAEPGLFTDNAWHARRFDSLETAISFMRKHSWIFGRVGAHVVDHAFIRSTR